MAKLKSVRNQEDPKEVKEGKLNDPNVQYAENLDTAQSVEPKRYFKTQGKFYHDLFKLKLAYFSKNVGLPTKPKWEKVEHCHYFHSHNSNGQKQTYCSSVGGHCHEVTVSTSPDGRLIAKCGPAYRKYRHNKGERLPDDHHTHEIEYISSEEVEMRKRNNKAANFISEYMSRLTPPELPKVGDENNNGQ